MITEKEIIEQLRTGKLTFPPLIIRFVESEPAFNKPNRFDAILDVIWNNDALRFAVECKAASTPKIFRNALNQLKMASYSENVYPMLIVPFLNELQLMELEKERISGIDLCGNGIVIVPGRLSVFRSGQKNQFPSSAPIKNIYRRNSSMVSRIFLSKKRFESVRAICDEVNCRNILVQAKVREPMSLATVSKTLKTLEDDLIIERGDSINLLQAEKLLEKMAANYVQPRITDRVRLKVPGDRSDILNSLVDCSNEAGIPLIATGVSSVIQYAVMQRGDVLSLYCPRIAPMIDRVSAQRNDRFPNLELIETDDEPVYFDSMQKDGFWWASAIQVYLELMLGDSRDKETAEQVKSYIIGAVTRSGT